MIGTMLHATSGKVSDFFPKRILAQQCHGCCCQDCPNISWCLGLD